MKSLKTLLSWAVGVSFFITGVASLFTDGVFEGIIFLLMSSFLIPPIINFITKITGVTLSFKRRIIPLFLLFIIVGIFIVIKEKGGNIEYFSQNKTSVLNNIQANIDEGNFDVARDSSEKYLVSNDEDLQEIHNLITQKVNEKREQELLAREQELIAKNKNREQELLAREQELIAKNKNREQELLAREQELIAKNKNREQELLAEVKSIQTSEYRKNRDIYKELVSLNSNNDEYQEKLGLYEKQLREDEIEKARPSLDSITFGTIRDYYNNSTEARWDIYKVQQKGKRIEWTGWVDDVEKDMFGDYYTVNIDMDSPEDIFSIYDLTLNNISETTALKFTKLQKTKFNGIIESMDDILGTVHVAIEPVFEITYYRE